MKRPALLLSFALAAGFLPTACGGEEPAATTAGAPPPTASPVTAAPPTSVPPTTGVPAPTAAPTTPTTEPTPPPTTNTPPPPPTTEAGPLRIVVSVVDGVVTGEQRVVVDRGTEIELTVTSNQPDEVHVHGYDYKSDVDASTPAVILFVADLTGIYEVELEDSRLLLLELEVR